MQNSYNLRDYMEYLHKLICHFAELFQKMQKKLKGENHST